MDTIDAAKMFTRRTDDPLKENGASTSNKGQALKISQTFLFVAFKHFKLLFCTFDLPIKSIYLNSNLASLKEIIIIIII